MTFYKNKENPADFLTYVNEMNFIW